MNKKFTLLLFFVFFALGAIAQNGTIRGKVTDTNTGEELIGVTVVIDGTTKGAPTDLDGNYNITGLEAGTYSLKVSYISYETKIIQDIEVIAGEVTVQNITLGEAITEMEAVIVVGELENQTEAALLTMQKKSPVVQDGISKELFARTGDRNAAAAMQRVTGVSIEGGKYVYVRGLGDRYTKTTLNRAEIPGLDPSRNTVQMDLFPSNLIDNIIVLKTFSPDVPANFAGGYVNINTKDFPETFTFQFGASFSYNDQTTFNSNFIGAPNQGSDALGFGRAGVRQIPGEVNNANNGTRFNKNIFNDEMNFVTRSPFLNQTYSLSLGNQSTLFGKQFGYIAAISYRRSFNYYEDGVINRFDNTGAGSEILNNRYRLAARSGNDQVLWGGLLNLSLKLSDKSKIGFNLMRNQSGENSALFASGTFIDIGNDITYQTTTLAYVQRSLSTLQLKGEHVFGGNNMELDWITSYSVSTQDEPDLRYFTNGIENGDYIIPPGSAREPSRFFRDMVETNLDTKVDLTIPLSDTETKLKFGGSLLLKNRDFNEQIFQYLSQAGVPYGITPQDYVANDNVTSEIQSATALSNSYIGEQIVAATYAMIDWRVAPRLRILTGARMEITDLTVTSDNPSRPIGKLENVDILPAFNLTYELQEDMNLRFAYGRTLARPTFRELADYPTFEFVGDFILRGNANLERTLIDNFDIRWEVFPNAGEIITASLFYKRFENPIATIIDPRAGAGGTGEKIFNNLPTANVLGAELELRKNLGFITSTLQNFTFGFNFTYIQSQIDIDEEERQAIIINDPTRTESTRPLNAQSPYILNTFLNYDQSALGWKANLNFNIFGARLSEIGVPGAPDVYEQPRPVLDFALSKEFGAKRQWRLSFRARNLLNPEFKFIQTFKGNDNIYRNFTIGRTYSLGIRYLID